MRGEGGSRVVTWQWQASHMGGAAFPLGPCVGHWVVLVGDLSLGGGGGAYHWAGGTGGDGWHVATW